MAQRCHRLHRPTAESHLRQVSRSPGAPYKISRYSLHTNTDMNFQLRIAFVTYGLPSTRPSPILYKRYFSKLEVLKRDSLEIPELVGLGRITNEESERDGMAILDGFACALEVSTPHEPSLSKGSGLTPITDVRSARCDSNLEFHPHHPPDLSRCRIPTR